MRIYLRNMRIDYVENEYEQRNKYEDLLSMFPHKQIEDLEKENKFERKYFFSLTKC
jgi:hypothetical protein